MTTKSDTLLWRVAGRPAQWLWLGLFVFLMQPGSAWGADADTSASSAPPPAVVKVFNRPVAILRGVNFGYTPKERAAYAEDRIAKLVEAHPEGEVGTRPSSEGTIITIGGERAFTLTPGDVDVVEGQTLEQTVQTSVKELRSVIGGMQKQREWPFLIRASLLSLVATVIFVLVAWAVWRVQRWLMPRVNLMVRQLDDRLMRGGFVVLSRMSFLVRSVGFLSTKILTFRREAINLPNLMPLSTSLKIFSRMTGGAGVALNTSVTIGYDTPWRQVEGLLFTAAGRTPGLRREPAPFVLQKSLADFFVEYELNVTLEDPIKRVFVFSTLHANIQDAFNEYGVQIMSPHYRQDPPEKVLVPRERWFVPPAAADPANPKPGPGPGIATQTIPMKFAAAWLLTALALAGCQGGSYSKYVSPRVTGRVLAADTRQPLADATVRRVVPMMTAGEDTPPKGAQLIMQPAGVRTDADGQFTLEAERVVAVFRHVGWYSVAVSFACPGYENLQTNFTAVDFKARTPEGAPWVSVGDILLQPKPR